MLSPAEILGPSGRIAARLKHYEHRPEQLAMAEAVSRAIDATTHLVVEAGTGVGKSFAYLVPAILAVAGEPPEAGEEEKKPPRRVVISTHTISLQEQLIHKDIPFLNSVIPLEFTAVLVKGRGNYLSQRRLRNAMRRAASLFSQEEEFAQLRRIEAWSKTTEDGSLSDLEFRPLGQVWDEVASDQGNCMGRRCPAYQACFTIGRGGGRATPRCWWSTTRCCLATWPCACRGPAVFCPTTRSSSSTKPTTSKAWRPIIWGWA